MRWVIIILLLIIGYLQYRLWWGDGGRLELRRLEQRVVDSELDFNLLIEFLSRLHLRRQLRSQ
ncbi:MAG: cell division protein FtsB, partial [Pseudomonadota bacterium]